MNQSELHDLLASDTHDLLADTTITIYQNRPASVIDPDTRKRILDAGAKNESVEAVEGFDGKTEVNGAWIRARSWHVIANATSFVPERGGFVVDAQSVQWNIYKVEQRINARAYEVFAELIG